MEKLLWNRWNPSLSCWNNLWIIETSFDSSHIVLTFGKSHFFLSNCQNSSVSRITSRAHLVHQYYFQIVQINWYANEIIPCSFRSYLFAWKIHFRCIIHINWNIHIRKFKFQLRFKHLWNGFQLGVFSPKRVHFDPNWMKLVQRHLEPW